VSIEQWMRQPFFFLPGAVVTSVGDMPAVRKGGGRICG